MLFRSWLAADKNAPIPTSANARGSCAAAGQRLCIGKEFSLMEGQFILARIAQRYDVSAVPGREAQVHIATSIRAKDGVWVHLKTRKE